MQAGVAGVIPHSAETTGGGWGGKEIQGKKKRQQVLKFWSALAQWEEDFTNSSYEPGQNHKHVKGKHVARNHLPPHVQLQICPPKRKQEPYTSGIRPCFQNETQLIIKKKHQIPMKHRAVQWYKVRLPALYLIVVAKGKSLVWVGNRLQKQPGNHFCWVLSRVLSWIRQNP